MFYHKSIIGHLTIWTMTSTSISKAKLNIHKIYQSFKIEVHICSQRRYQASFYHHHVWPHIQRRSQFKIASCPFYHLFYPRSPVDSASCPCLTTISAIFFMALCLTMMFYFIPKVNHLACSTINVLLHFHRRYSLWMASSPCLTSYPSAISISKGFLCIFDYISNVYHNSISCAFDHHIYRRSPVQMVYWPQYLSSI